MTIIRVDQNHPQIKDEIAADKLLSGQAATSLWNAFSDSTDQYHVGQWESKPCSIKVAYEENELCVILKGEVELTDAKSNIHRFNQGDAFVIPAGFEGTWTSLTDVLKIYASFEQNKDVS